MSSFRLYFSLGHEHILDFDGYDHILFVIALCAIYAAKDWKKILILVTAFTIGHSVTLALSTLDIVKVNIPLIEFLIPVTIFITALSNVITPVKKFVPKRVSINYVYALLFGLIHGLGFSSYLKGVLGKGQSIIVELLAFNLGLELGQLLIVMLYLLLTFLFISVLNVPKLKWSLITSSMIMGIALTMLIETKFW